jgi:predicted nucleotidyltransferase
MDRDAVLELLGAHADELRKLGVTALYLYGSTALDRAQQRSDVDLFADVDYSRFGFIAYMDIRERLVAILGRHVDFTTRAALHPDLRSRIIGSAIKVFGDATLAPAPAE